jgi:peptidoglycan L-alanyl-D-glutamate endopeptidase CwlK
VSRRLEDLSPLHRDRFTNWLMACDKAGLDLLVTCTLRTNAEQDELFAQGRSKPGSIVTNARGGQSAHNYGLALDFVPMGAGKPMWKSTHPDWKTAGELAPKFGLEWAGTWKKFREFPHVQVPSWKGFIS